jgi:hypothetical protein
VHGLNELTEAPPVPAWRRLLGQFKELVIWIPIVAAVISGVVGELADAVAILAIVLLNGIIGFFRRSGLNRPWPLSGSSPHPWPKCPQRQGRVDSSQGTCPRRPDRVRGT